jgi:hypothetical protein
MQFRGAARLKNAPAAVTAGATATFLRNAGGFCRRCSGWPTYFFFRK